MKAHDGFNEKWLQARLAEDPGLLGLGDLEIKDVERRQPRAGRLDLLLVEPETHDRYEVEIQLGATDETHIIRTIEYWDIERRTAIPSTTTLRFWLPKTSRAAS